MSKVCKRGHVGAVRNSKGDCVVCHRARNKTKEFKIYSKTWVKNNQDKIKEYRSLRAEKTAKEARLAYAADPHKFTIRTLEWRSKNKGKYNAITRKYRVKKLNALPAWADLKAIEAKYIEAKNLTDHTGIKYHVDHIIPLQGKFVSGLHVTENLQVITAHENAKKHNTFIIG